MKKLKIMVVVGTRPEIIRLSRVLPRLEEHVELILVHTGQNYDYELNEIFFTDLGLKQPDHYLGAAGETAAVTIGNVIIMVDSLLQRLKPDALLILGDTNSCMAVLPAKRRKIPTFHMEAGNRCFDMRVPEEINRRIVDHTADVNMPYSDIARSYLLSEGLPPDRIIKTGSPMFEVLNHYDKQIKDSQILELLGLSAREFFLVSVHREENIDSDEKFEKFVDVLNTVASKYKLPIIVSTHPRTQKRFDRMDMAINSSIRLLKPLGFFDYNKLQTKALTVLSDSGTINEEATILNFAALNLRETHERPEAMDAAAVMMVGMDKVRVIQGLEILNSVGLLKNPILTVVPDYCIPNVSEKVVRIILSYRDYVMRVVWKQY